MENYSLSDIRSVVDGNSGFGGSNGFLWVILIFLFFLGFNRGGLFGNGYEGYNGLSQIERDVLNTSCNTQKEVLESRYTTQLGFQSIGAQMAQCCCDLKTAIHAEGEETRALIQANTIQDLRDRLALANDALTTQTVSQNVINAVRPFPAPAYLTCSPYQNVPFPAYNYGYSCGGTSTL